MTILTAPRREDMLFDAWLYAAGITDNARRKLTDADVRQQPNDGAQWDRLPLLRLANWYVREGDSDSEFIQKIRHDAHRGLTSAQVRGACNVLLGDFKRGKRWDWMAQL